MDGLAARSGCSHPTGPLRRSVCSRFQVRTRNAQSSSPVLLVRTLGSCNRTNLAFASSRGSAILRAHGAARNPDAAGRAAACVVAAHGPALVGHAAPVATRGGTLVQSESGAECLARNDAADRG